MKGLTNAQTKGGSTLLAYNVTFKVDGADYYIASCLEGETISPPPKPIVTGKVFLGWQINGVDVTFPYAPTANVEMVANLSASVIVGMTGLTNSNSVLTWTDDIADLNTVPPYSTTVDGSNVTANCVLQSKWPFTEIQEFTDASGNAFIKFPKMWQKWVTDASGNIDGVKFCNVQADTDYFLSDAYLKSDDTSVYNDYFALGKYEGSGSTTQMYSKTGQTCLVSVTRAQCRTASKANGATYQQLDISQYVLYNMLTMLKYRTSNIQSVYAGRTSFSAATLTGDTDLITGLDGWNTASGAVKMNGVENPYGNIYKWVDGIFFSNTLIYVHRLPTQFADSTTGALNLNILRSSVERGYTKYLKSGATLDTRGYAFCTDSSGSNSTYYADSYYSSSGTVLSVGGYWPSGTSAGLWSLSGRLDASGSYTHVGSRLSYRPS